MAEKDDKDMTPDERLAWLRERGVQVETSEERRAGAIAKALREAETLGEEEEITYVLVPADTSKPLKELKFKTKVTGGDVLVDHLKSAFASSGKTVGISLLQKQADTALLGSSGAPTTVSDEALQKVASEASVEVFALVHPRPSNKFHAVNVYLDEAGMLKRLPLNSRASRYAELAGFHPVPQFYGDIFLGRVLHYHRDGGPAVLKNAPFYLGVDTALDAHWIKFAATENLEYQMEMNSITGRNETQPAVAGSDGKSKQEDGFSWTQTEQELELTVPLPSDFDKKALEVKFRPQSLQVSYAKKHLVTVRIFERVDVDSCTWTVDRGAATSLVVTMEKLEEALWPRIID